MSYFRHRLNVLEMPLINGTCYIRVVNDAGVYSVT